MVRRVTKKTAKKSKTEKALSSRIARLAKPRAGKSLLSDPKELDKGKNKWLLPPSRWPNSWSYSKYRSRRECPRAYMLQHLKKLQQPEGRALIRGTEIHMKGEAYLNGQTKGLPDEYNLFAKEMAQLKRRGAVAEGSWTLTRDGKKTTFDDWERAWLRAKIDAKLKVDKKTLLIVDFKTGRHKVDVAQMELYAAMAPHFEEFETVTVELWFLEHDKTESHTWTRKQCLELWKKWVAKGEELLADRTFVPRPEAERCKRCYYRSDTPMKNHDGELGPCNAWKDAA